MSRSAALNDILLDHLRTIDPHAWPGIDGLTLDVVLDSYSQAALAGQVPGKSELLPGQHPELAAELETLFATRLNLRRIDSRRFRRFSTVL